MNNGNNYLPAEYTGDISQTFQGYECLNWDDFDLDYPDADLSGHNYCRAPDGNQNGAWCIVMLDDGSYGPEYCACRNTSKGNVNLQVGLSLVY